MTQEPSRSSSGSGQWVEVIVAWTLVGVPLLWGVMETIRKASLLFE